MHVYNEHKHLPEDERKEFVKPPCENCGYHETPKKMQQHHIWPQRWHWPDHLRDLCMWLCPKCHGEVGVILTTLEYQFGTDKSCQNQLQKWVYPTIALNFSTEPSIYINENRKYLI